MERYCRHCAAIFSRSPGTIGRPPEYCSADCRKAERAALRVVKAGPLEPWTDEGLERWEPLDDFAGTRR